MENRKKLVNYIMIYRNYPAKIQWKIWNHIRTLGVLN